MRVLVVANYLPIKQRSMDHFAMLLQQELAKRGVEHKVVRPPAVFGAIKPAEQGLGKWLGYIDRFLIFPPLLMWHVQWADVVHLCDHSNGMYTRYFKHKPHVITCHDMISIRSALGAIPEQRLSWTGRVFQSLILRGLRQASRLVCVSGQTRDELVQISGIPRESTAVIYNGLNYPFRPMRDAEARSHLLSLGLADRPFVLHVGGNQFYKNRLGVLRIYSEFRQWQSQIALVMAGRPLTQPMRLFIVEHGMGKDVIEVQNCSNETLRALYSVAEALLFPSLYEGFGWPIIEAQACDCPVFTSNRAPMSEIAGAGAVLIDPTHPAEAAARVLEHLPDRERLVAAGRENVAQYSTERMLTGYIGEYEALYRKRPRAPTG